MNLQDYGLKPQRPEAIDASMLVDFMNCPSYFYLRHVLGLRSKRADAQREAPLSWGTVWHRVMHVWRETQDPVKALSSLDPWPPGLSAEADRHARSKARMAQIFFEYVEKFAERDRREFETLHSEQFFDVTDPTTGLRWSGRFDGLERRRRNKRLVLWDYKTTSRMGERYFDQHEFSFQLPGYVWAINQLSTGEPVEEVMLDVLYTLKGSHEFFRRTFHYTAERLAEWRHNVQLILSRLYCLLDERLEEPEAWEKNWSWCTIYGLCAFAPVHFTTPSRDTRLRILENDYVEDRWSPLVAEEAE